MPFMKFQFAPTRSYQQHFFSPLNAIPVHNKNVL